MYNMLISSVDSLLQDYIITEFIRLEPVFGGRAQAQLTLIRVGFRLAASHPI